MKKFLAFLLTICFVLFTGVGVYADMFTSENTDDVRVDFAGDDTGADSWFDLSLPGDYDDIVVEEMFIELTYENASDIGNDDLIHVYIDPGAVDAAVETIDPILGGGPYTSDPLYITEFSDDFIGEGTIDIGYGCHFDHDKTKLTIYYHYGVPEPATMLLLGSGLIVLAGFRRKFK